MLNPLYESSQAEATRKGLEGEALLAVRAQAEALATGLSGRLGRLVEVSSITPSSPQVFDQGFPYSYIENFNGQSTPLPEVTVRASVTLRYKFMPR